MNTCNNNVQTYITSTYRGFISFGCKDYGLQTSNLHNRKWEFSDFALTSVWNFHVLHICLRKPILWTETNKHTWIAATHVEITVWSGSFYVRATFTTWVQKEKHAESKSRVCMNKIIATIQYAVSWLVSQRKKTNQMSKLNRIKWE